jgi:hypothetical protein
MNFITAYDGAQILVGAVPPVMVKTAANPGGLPIECSMAPARHSTRPAPSFISISPPAVSRPQTRRSKGQPGLGPGLVAPGQDGQRQSPLRLHRGLLGDGLHGGYDEAPLHV